jgi:hypothetical protein
MRIGDRNIIYYHCSLKNEKAEKTNITILKAVVTACICGIL